MPTGVTVVALRFAVLLIAITVPWSSLLAFPRVAHPGCASARWSDGSSGISRNRCGLAQIVARTPLLDLQRLLAESGRTLLGFCGAAKVPRDRPPLSSRVGP